MRKINSAGLKVIIAFLLVFSSMQGIVAKAFWDFTPPVISSITVDKNQVYDGDKVTLTINAIDDESIIKDVDVWYHDGEGYLRTYETTYNQQTKQVKLEIPINSLSSLGNWTIDEIWFYYDNGTFNTVDASNPKLSDGKFEVLAKPATPGTGTSPSLSISSITVDKYKVYNGESVYLTINAVDNISNIKDLDVWYTDGKGFLKTYKASYNLQTKQVQINIPITSISSLGNWVISSIWFYYENGSFKIVEQQNAALSSGTFEVIVKPDLQSPVFNGISVEKKEVVLGNSVKVSVNAEDVDSGIDKVSVSYITPNGDTQTREATYNWFEDSYEAMISVSDFSNIGNWQIASVYVKDKKGNKETIYNSGLYSSGVTQDLSSGNFQAVEDRIDTLATFDHIRYYPNDITLENETISGDVYVGPNAVLTIKGNVTINGDLHVFGAYSLAGNLRVTGTWNLTKKLDYVPIWLDNQPLTAINGKMNISGKTLPFVSMSLEGQNVPIQSDGTFELNNVNVQGKQGITIRFLDLSGNEIVRQFLVKQETKAAPSAPIVNEVSDKDTVVTGSAEAGSRVEVTVNGLVIGTATAGSDGQFSITIPMQDTGKELVVTVTDSFGNVSEPTTVLVNDRTSPGQPVVNNVTDMDTFVTGQAEVGSRVEVKVNKSIIGTSTTGEDGQYKVTIPVQKSGIVLSITATDKTGNVSEARTVVVKDATGPVKPVVNEVTDKDTSVTGRAESGSKVEVKVNGSVIGTGTVGEDAQYNVTISLQKVGTELIIISTDKAGNVSETTTVVVKDATAPAKPEVNEVTDKDTTVSGKAEAGSKVEVKVINAVIGTGTVGEDGQFKVTIPKQKAGTELIIRATDKSGNISETTTVVVKDATAPVKPVINEVTDKDTTVSGKAEAGSKVEVMVNGSVIGTGTVGEDSQFKVTIPKQKSGTELVIRATDKAGNISESTTVVVKDATAPVKPVVNEVTDKDTTVSGKAEAGSKVEVMVNGSVIGTGTVGEDSQFKVTIPKQKAGAELVIRATDKAGNVSETTTVVVKDATAPAKPVVNEVTDKDTTVSGKAEAGSKVEVKVINSVIGTGTVGEDGQFKVTISAQKAGTELIIRATDKSGNISETTIVVVKDATAPVKPVVNEITDKDTTVSGKAEAGSKVEVTVNGSVIGTGTVGEDSQFKVTIPKQKAGAELVIRATDKAGNISETTTVVVKDATAPAKPGVSRVNDRDTTITGVAEAGSKVEVKVNGSVIGTGTAGEDGKYKVTIRVQKAGTVLVITATDTVGNQSEGTIIKVIDKTATSVLTVNTVSDKSKEVTGKTEAGATVSILIGTKIYAAKADTNGNFKVIIPILKAGTKLIVTAKDAAGNVSVAKSITVIDKTPPVTPTVSTVSDLAKVVTGKAEAGAIVTVTIGTKKYIAKADTKGNYKVTIPVQKAGTKVIVTAKDAAGNVSVAKSVIVIDKTAPLAPKIKTAVKSTTKEVTGTAEAYSTITIKVGKKVIGTGKTDSRGKFKVKIKAKKKKTVLIVTATDKAKNVSKTSTVKVK